MTFSLRTFASSDIGLVRTTNQDSAYVSPSLIMVADGMGGAAAGDLASAVAVRELVAADKVNRDPQDRLAGEDMLTVLGGALTRTNDTLADLVVSDHSLEGMGTTACGAMFSGTQFGVAHIGDSRGYLLRDGQLSRLTRDHSWVQSLVDDGKLTEEEALVHPQRSLLMKVLNGQPTHKPDLSLVDAQLGDRVLFCSDGLAGLVTDDVIGHVLAEPDLETVVERLRQAAYGAGGSDNVSIIVADVVEFDSALEGVVPQVLGAAQNVTIPEPPGRAPIDLGDTDEDLPPSVPAAPAPVPTARRPRPIPVDAEQMRYQPTEANPRRRWIPVLVVALLLVLLATGAIFFLRHLSDSQFFIAPEDDTVAIYQGLPDPFPFVADAKVRRSTEINVDDLPPYYADQVRDRKLVYPTLEQASEQVDHLEELADKCILERQNADTPSTQEPAVTPSAPSSTTSPQASASPSDRPDLEDCG